MVYIFDPVSMEGVVQASDDILSIPDACAFQGYNIALSLPRKLVESLRKRNPRTVIGLLLPDTQTRIIDYYVEQRLEPKRIDDFTSILEMLTRQIDTEKCGSYEKVGERINDAEVDVQQWIRRINEIGYEVCYCTEKMRHGIIMNDKCVIPRWE